jgi:hypothetical protein
MMAQLALRMRLLTAQVALGRLLPALTLSTPTLGDPRAATVAGQADAPRWAR